MLRHKTLRACLAIALGWLIVSPSLLAFAQEYRPPKRGLPGRREGAGTRGTCLEQQNEAQKILMPLTPTDGFSATTSNSPTFFWYVPPTSVSAAEFALLDDKDQPLYKTMVELPKTGGIVSYKVPEAVTKSVLQTGKDFYWQFSVICNPEQLSFNPFVEGVVQRIKPDASLTSQIKKAASSRDRATVYASVGLWQDAIATLAQQRCARPNDTAILTSWTTLLKSVSLEAFATEPLTSSCAAINPKPGK